jgi:5'-3' exonuclease
MRLSPNQGRGERPRERAQKETAIERHGAYRIALAVTFPRLHLVDGTFELYRAHFSPRPGDEATKATKGIVSSLKALLADRDEAVTHLAVAFDNPIRSFRNDLFAGYKSDDGVPPPLRAQFDAAEEAVKALGIVVWSMKEFECDDAIASACVKYAKDFDQIRIMSPDKDFGQCLSGKRVVMVDRIRKTETDESAMRARRGVGPESIPDLLALTGDDADGIPGLPGFGEKTASALLAKFVHVDDIPKDASKWPAVRGAAKLAEVLNRSRKDVALYRKLATLVTDAPLKEKAAALAVKPQ